MAVKQNTVLLKGSPLRKEGVASEAITAGQLIEPGGSHDLRKHSVAGGNARKAFAVEYDPFGEIDDPCKAGDQVMYVVGRSGDEVFAFLKAGVNAAKGAALESAGDGSLQLFGTAEEEGAHGNLVGYALEAINNTGGAAVRIKVEVA